MLSSGKTTGNYQEQYDLGMKYLEEGSYEEAILAFTAAIEIDPRQADAYLGLAEVYIAQNKFDKALEILQKGYDLLGDERLRSCIDEIESGNFSDYWGNVRSLYYYDENGQLAWSQQYDYDSERKQVKSTSFSADGVESSHVEFEYNEDGKVIRGGGGYFVDDGILILMGIEYNADGQISKRNLYSSITGEMESYTINLYEDGELIRREDYGADGVLRNYSITYIDEEGNSVNEDYSGDGELLRYYINEYDDNGVHTAQVYYDAEGNIMHWNSYEYDADGYLAKQVTYDADGNVTGEYVYN